MKNYQTAADRAGTTGRATPKKAKVDPRAVPTKAR